MPFQKDKNGLRCVTYPPLPPKGGIPLDKLIERHLILAQDCSDEIDCIVREHNDRRPNSLLTEEDTLRFIASFNENRRVARDTVAWLKTLQRQTESGKGA